MRKLLILIGLTALFIGSVQAQTACPTGVAPGSPQCGPSPEYHGVSNAAIPGAYNQSAPIVMKQKWADRWAAIVIDNNQPIVGVSTGLKNKRLAEKAAIEDCKKQGGGECVLRLTYYNQCGALLAKKGGGGFVAKAPTEKEAVEYASDMCKKAGGQCTVYYTNCSMSEEYWVRQ